MHYAPLSCKHLLFNLSTVSLKSTNEAYYYQWKLSEFITYDNHRDIARTRTKSVNEMTPHLVNDQIHSGFAKYHYFLSTTYPFLHTRKKCLKYFIYPLIVTDEYRCYSLHVSSKGMTKWNPTMYKN